MALFDTFKETVFINVNNELLSKINALGKIKNKVQEKEQLERELMLLQKGLDGENKIRFELENANIGMYVLHDVTLEYEGSYAQIDYIIITRFGNYFVECKNLLGNVTVTSEGEFRREYIFNDKKYKEAIFSPYAQAKRHLDMYKKIWQKNHSKIALKLFGKAFDKYNKPLVVLANAEGLLKIRYAPEDVKKAILKVDQLVNYLEKDIQKADTIDLSNAKDMKEIAEWFMEINVKRDIDYTEKYTIMESKATSTNDTNKREYNRYNPKPQKPIQKSILNKKEKSNTDEELRQKLMAFRKERSKEKNIPAYYVFKNDELENLVKLKPKTIEELKKLKILDDVKIKCHGEEIIKIIYSHENT